MANDFAVQIEYALKEYSEQVNQTMQKVLPEVAKEAAKKIQGDAPKKTGKYASGGRKPHSLILPLNQLSTMRSRRGLHISLKKATQSEAADGCHLQRSTLNPLRNGSSLRRRDD